MARGYICSRCEAEGEPDDAHCSECGWDGVICAFLVDPFDPVEPDEDDLQAEHVEAKARLANEGIFGLWSCTRKTSP